MNEGISLVFSLVHCKSIGFTSNEIRKGVRSYWDRLMVYLNESVNFFNLKSNNYLKKIVYLEIVRERLMFINRLAHMFSQISNNIFLKQIGLFAVTKDIFEFKICFKSGSIQYKLIILFSVGYKMEYFGLPKKSLLAQFCQSQHLSKTKYSILPLFTKNQKGFLDALLRRKCELMALMLNEFLTQVTHRSFLGYWDRLMVSNKLIFLSV
ncbi:hypothetical protein BpHYR1_032240 [Brachionus plicatilis]|uniref:Uncharacterized protein n=1 Tax=Brachionus plicatilis TaxID=10195 RepID=A0A3M7T9P6_BRAPC|nr:hypothetical protein BpHYR1_032240 [Brachionus plicatilis]